MLNMTFGKTNSFRVQVKTVTYGDTGPCWGHCSWSSYTVLRQHRIS